MPYLYAWDHRGVVVTYSGKITFNDFMNVVLTIHEHPDYTQFKSVLHDMGKVTELDFAGVDMAVLMAQEIGARYSNPIIKVAIVTSDPKMGEMIQLFSSKATLKVHAFQTLDEGIAWSGSVRNT